MDVDALVEHGYRIDTSADIPMLVWRGGGCRIATDAESKMWVALLALRDDVAKWQGIAAREASHGAEVWAERDALRAERDALREALDRYGCHDEDCRKFRVRGTSCDCGYAAALFPAEQPTGGAEPKDCPHTSGASKDAPRNPDCYWCAAMQPTGGA